MSATKRPEPACRTLMKWLKLNLGSLGALTGTDSRALHAAAHLIEMYQYDGSGSTLEAFRAVVLKMQPSTREFAYHAIAHFMEWDDRARISVAADLPDIPVRRCAGERAA